MNPKNSRRRFLAQSLMAGSAAALLPKFGLVGEALAATRGQVFGNYRALVCLYLDGGNDSWNLLVPRDNINAGSRYDIYRQARGGVYNATSNPGGLALNFDALRAISPIGEAVNSFGLHPQCGNYTWPPTGGTTQDGMATLFNGGRLAFLSNVGTLVEPITKQNYASRLRPPQLYSHNDQSTLWHLGRTDGNHPHGWGGEVASRVSGGNGNTALSPCLSIAGGSRFLVGDGIYPYQMSTSGATPLSNYTTSAGSTSTTSLAAQRGALLELIVREHTHTHPMAAEYARLMTRSIDLAGAISTGLATTAGRVDTPYDYAGATPPNPATGVYPNAQLRYSVDGVNTLTSSNSLLDQLRMVARMIKLSHPTLSPSAGFSHERQIYFVRLGGFDTHDTQMANAGQPLLMARINQAVAWFQKAMDDLQIADQVTLFSMSEFARTLSTNGNGSDHAWGGVQFAVGGAVVGKRIYGGFPNQTLDGPDCFSRGQFLPTVAVDQFAGSLARWMGVPDIDLEHIFPNLVNFNPDTLGFLP